MTIASWAANLMVVSSFLSLVQWVGIGGTFLLYAVRSWHRLELVAVLDNICFPVEFFAVCIHKE